MLPWMALALAMAFAAPATAQFRKIEIAFEGVGCEPCIESLPVRMKRMRGVETAAVDAAKGILTLTLAEENRVRLEQVRDAIQQDGTRTTWAEVEVRGEVANGQLQGPRGPAYRLSGEVSPGVKTITGRVENMREIVIAVKSVRE